MTTLPLFRAHSSRHAKPRPARRPSRLRSWLGAELSALRLWAQTTDCLTPQDPARLIVAASAGRTPDRAETGTAAGDAPGLAEPGAVPMSPDPAVVPFKGWQVPDDWRLPGGRGLMRVGHPPWTGELPRLAPPAPPVPAPLDPGDGLGPQVRPNRPYTDDVPVYGEVSVSEVLEAERLAEAMIP